MTLPSANLLADIDAPWTAIYCKPRQEKALAWDLCRKEVPYFFPMIYRETTSGGRRRRNLYPMFKSYLFFAGDEDQRLSVWKTNRLVNVVEIEQAAQEEFRREITSLELGLRTAPESIELHSRLVEGTWVRVIAGPMKGAEGVILEAESHTKLQLGVTLMGTAARLEIPRDFVEPYEQHKDDRPRSSVTVAYDLDART